jgi:DNA-binding SARP family transcriptional activator/tetratricopeptide (TPR) repeat protein
MVALEFRLLGEVAALHRGKTVDVGYTRQRCVLAVLLVDAGRVVPVDALLDRVWADSQPRHARNALSGYVSRLRQILAACGGVELSRAEGGYRLAIDPLSVDLHRFRDLIGQARAAIDDKEALDRFEQALELWRGAVFATLDTPWLCDMRTVLEAEQLTAVLDRNDLALRVGRHTDLLSELSTCADKHPLNERVAGQLMHALYRSGRQADALRHYERVRSTLADELGTDPSPPLRELHRRILNADPTLTPHSPVALDNTTDADQPTPQQTPTPTLIDYPQSGGTWSGITPTADRVFNRVDTHAYRTVRDIVIHSPALAAASGRNDLPGDIADFAGRRKQLDTLLTAGEATQQTAPVIHVLDGMPGVGKTTLAVHAAHRLAHRYPDAQLFIDLHGHSPNQPPVTPMTALHTLLGAVGVPSEEIPDDQDARTARWRAELSSRKLLVLLDNAADAAQVRPLLPGTRQSLALITSRRRLVDLDTVHVMSLDVLGEDDAIALFTGIVGDDRVSDDADALHQVVTQCGHLPLAIRVAAARLRSRQAWSMRHLANRLHQAYSPLVELSVGDRDVAAALALSYEQLTEPQQRTYRLLGVHPGPDIDTEAAAILTALDPTHCGHILDSLVDDHLVQEPTTGRYQLHDLIREHAHAVARIDEPDITRHDALHRVIDFYLHTAHHGSQLLEHHDPPINIDEPMTGCIPSPLTDETAAMAWFDANHNNILAAQTAAEKAGWDKAVWQLGWTLDNFHYRRGYFHDNISSWLTGLAATERLKDLDTQARAHRRLALVYATLGVHKQQTALHHLKQSRTLSEQTGYLLGQAATHLVLGFAWTCWNDSHQALTHLTHAKNLYHDLGNTQWETRSLSMIGACHTRLGHHYQAHENCQTALALCQRRGDLFGQASSLDNLGAIAAATGHHTQALHHYKQALALWHTLDSIYYQAGTLTALGDTYRDLTRHQRARHAWQQAIDLYRKQNLDAAAAQVEQRLTDLTKTNHPKYLEK